MQPDKNMREKEKIHDTYCALRSLFTLPCYKWIDIFSHND